MLICSVFDSVYSETRDPLRAFSQFPCFLYGILLILTGFLNERCNYHCCKTQYKIDRRVDKECCLACIKEYPYACNV